MKHSVLYIFFLGLFMTSCQSVSFLTIEVKRPAEIVIPESVQNVVIVNNSEDQPDDFGHTVYKFRSKEENPKLKTAGMADLFTQELAKRLNALQWFRVYQQKPEHSTKTFLEELPLNHSQIKEISDSTHADLIISLDRFIIETLIKLSVSNEQGLYRITMDGRAYPTLRLYDVNKDRSIYTLRQQDSLFWEVYDITAEQAVNRFPAPLYCFQDMVVYGVDRMMKKLVPYTESVDRLYFIAGNLNLHDAATYVKQNRWDDAASIWEYEYKHSQRKKIQAFTATNLALYYEISDKFDDAIEWAEKASLHFQQMKSTAAQSESERLVQYIRELKQRKGEAVKLEEQLH